MPNYKLTYFNLRGRAEACRLMFALAGVEYEDRRITKEEWAELKPKTKLGHLPELEVDGKSFGESRAIVTFLAREFGFYGKSNLDAFAIEEVLAILDDFSNAVITAYKGVTSHQEELIKDFQTVHLPKYMGLLEKLLKGKKFFLGDAVTVADVVCFNTVSVVQGIFQGATQDFPLVNQHVERVGNLDKIKAWIDKRPQTAM